MAKNGKKRRLVPPNAHAPSEDEIRKRAYEIYLGRAGMAGNALDDWLKAEAELKRAWLLPAQD
jgi:hypothetical protein